LVISPYQSPSLIAPSPSLSNNYATIYTENPLNRPSTASSIRSESNSSSMISRSRRYSFRPSPALTSWNDGDQTEFESLITQLTASANFPLSWVENPAWIRFCDRFLPGAHLPSRKVLTKRLIPTEVERFTKNAKKSAKGCYVTLQCDGWTSISFLHLIAFIITTSLREVSIYFLLDIVLLTITF
jgi:hypothetical protein